MQLPRKPSDLNRVPGVEVKKRSNSTELSGFHTRSTSVSRGARMARFEPQAQAWRHMVGSTLSLILHFSAAATQADPGGRNQLWAECESDAVEAFLCRYGTGSELSWKAVFVR